MEAGNDDFSISQDDRKVLSLWENTVSKENDHYVLPIPWTEGVPNFPDNYLVALHRLKGLERRLRRDDMFNRYDENMRKLLSEGYAEKVPEKEIDWRNESVWYIPHHCVTNPSKPDKLRIVFDCACKCQGVSLNDQCLQGPDLTNTLIGILLRFRQFRYAIMADIECMYYQVIVPEKDRNALRFLWWENDSLVHYRMRVHLFGGKWAGSASCFALRRTVQDHDVTDLVRGTVQRNFYIDDMLKSVKTKEDALEVIVDVKRALRDGGFKLTKFVVNDSELLDVIAHEDRAVEVKELTHGVHAKALGMMWEVDLDVFHYTFKIDKGQEITRRNMLSVVASMYDPLGLIVPVVLHGKLLFQEATRLKLDWDDSIPHELSVAWIDWIQSLEELKDLKFMRCVIPEECSAGVSELHVFCDASQHAFGACAYVRSVNPDGKIHVALLASKGRLAPLKQVTIPRLELSACVTAVQLDSLVRRELDLDLMHTTYWSDSKVALGYISNESRRFKTFVANRVSLIRENSDPSQWRHVPGNVNPADVLSRGCDSCDIPKTWREGPEFLKDHKSNWPAFEMVDISDDALIATCEFTDLSEVDDAADAGAIRESILDRLFQQFSSYYRLCKAVAWLLRFRDFLHTKVVKRGQIRATELKEAELCIIKVVQKTAYSGEIRDLLKTGRVSKSSAIYKLSPIMRDGVLVVGGRLVHSFMECKQPPILPKDHVVSDLIVREFHGDAHLGTEWTLSNIRRKFWIVGCRSIVKKVGKRCVVCKRLYSSPMIQKMADLPDVRCQSGGPPFDVVGVDLFGPLKVKVGRAVAKRYGCVFTCFKTRAVHIEVLDSLETDSFINGFIRFVARRGYPSKVYSDNATNLVGADAEMARCLRQMDKAKVISEARRKGIDWVFNPPHASHFGGVWERMIRTIRKILMALLASPSSRSLSDYVLQTVMCECECIINGRPITRSSDDAFDLNALTPNHLLAIRGIHSLPWGDFHTADTYRKLWRHAQYIVSQFWKRWTNEYLPLLQSRSKWQYAKENLKVGDLVLIVDASMPRGLWPLAIVESVKVGRDGLVRSASVRTNSSTFVRPISKLVLLEGDV
ncbi:uncharacterized protein LOC106152206 [Lingula anatina]|uniref:Uncharacterized protein LOC106152206 n=1 Tax=Lingula anatina TaxID=7574 RepID=A0A1S3H6R5_LINAN|nr:uncharacterized protein LOC106152206 [Lingula anatina]|eukprot:XP_013381171.1 uncharacterized protein LOC106152206 [Lingula anatina]